MTLSHSQSHFPSKGIILISLLLAILTFTYASTSNTFVPPQFSLDLDANSGNYTIYYQQQIWLRSEDIYFCASKTCYSVQNQTLKLVNTDQSTVTDNVGDGVVYSWQWQSVPNAESFITQFTVYNTLKIDPQQSSPKWAIMSNGEEKVRDSSLARAIKFTSIWSSGAEDITVNDASSVVSSFPSFIVEKSNVPSGVVQYAGRFSWSSTGAYPWDSTLVDGSNPTLLAGPRCGPLTIYDRSATLASVLSTFDEFMAAGMKIGRNPKTNEAYIHMGTLGSMTSIPVNYSASHILYFDNRGVTNAVMTWGDILLSQSSKVREDAFNEPTSAYLGYNTDHGGYYYYNPESGKNYQETLVDVQSYAASTSVPYQFYLIDSWWYYKGINDGVKNWTAMPSIFPDGLPALQKALDMTSFIAHNRYWAPDTTYAIQNGGTYEFIIDSQFSLPIDPQFWPDLMKNNSDWGLRVYEQDWLYNEFEGVQQMLQNVSLGKLWLTQMSDAAKQYDINIQYCMSAPRHVMQASTLTNVVQMRASDDYLPGNTDYRQYRLQDSSLFAWALGILPFKDSFWSTSSQPGSSGGSSFYEPAPDMQAAVSTYSAGPVTPSDGIKLANPSLIMRSARQDGLLLKPDRPAVSIDSTYAYRATHFTGPNGWLAHTYTQLPATSTGVTYSWHIVYAIDMEESYSLSTSEIYAANTDKFVAVSYVGGSSNIGNASVYQQWSMFVPLPIQECKETDFQIWLAAPLLTNGMAIYGEMNKWVPMSRQRVYSFDYNNNAVMIGLQGSAGENVEFQIYFSFSSTFQQYTCMITSTGKVLLTVNTDGTSKCTTP